MTRTLTPTSCVALIAGTRSVSLVTSGICPGNVSNPQDQPVGMTRTFIQAADDMATWEWGPPRGIVVVVVDVVGVAFTIAFASPRSVPALVTSC